MNHTIFFWRANDVEQQEEGALKRVQQTQVVGLGNAARMVYQLEGLKGFSRVNKPTKPSTFVDAHRRRLCH